MGQGSYFGEVAMLTGLKRTCSIYTVSNCYFGLIEKKTFLRFIEKNLDLKYNLLNNLTNYKDSLLKSLSLMVKNVPALRKLPMSCIKKIVNRLKQDKAIDGQMIVRTGELSDLIYFVGSGVVSVIVRDLDNE